MTKKNNLALANQKLTSLQSAFLSQHINNLEAELQQKEDVINKVKEFVKKHNERAGKLYYKYDNKYLLSEIREDLLKILDNKGDEK